MWNAIFLVKAIFYYCYIYKKYTGYIWEQIFLESVIFDFSFSLVHTNTRSYLVVMWSAVYILGECKFLHKNKQVIYEVLSEINVSKIVQFSRDMIENCYLLLYINI